MDALHSAEVEPIWMQIYVSTAVEAKRDHGLALRFLNIFFDDDVTVLPGGEVDWARLS